MLSKSTKINLGLFLMYFVPSAAFWVIVFAFVTKDWPLLVYPVIGMLSVVIAMLGANLFIQGSKESARNNIFTKKQN